MKYYISIFIFILITGTYAKAQPFTHDAPQEVQATEVEKKYVLLVFSGSDWCKPCIQLKQNILTNEAFTKYSSNQLQIKEVDFPYKRKNKLSKEQAAENDKLAEQYNKEGVFPKVLLFNKEKEVIGTINYEKHMTVKEFIYLIDSQIEKQ